MRLPYIRAIIKEVSKILSLPTLIRLYLCFDAHIHIQVQRVHAPFWMATPHCSSEDFVYNGMYIPKGTVLVLNCFTMHHNEERYPDS